MIFNYVPGESDNIKDTITKEIKFFWKQMLTEFLCMFFLTFVESGPTVAGLLISIDKKVLFLNVTTYFSLAVGIIVHIISHANGGHIVFTFLNVVAGNISIMTAELFWISQLAGIVAGSALCGALSPSVCHEYCKANMIKVFSLLNYFLACVTNVFISFFLVLAVSIMFDRQQTEPRHKPMVIGLVAFLCQVFGFIVIGVIMDPENYLGTANNWNDMIVFKVCCVGPLMADAFARFTYETFGDVISEFEFPFKKSKDKIPADMNQQTQGESKESEDEGSELSVEEVESQNP